MASIFKEHLLFIQRLTESGYCIVIWLLLRLIALMGHGLITTCGMTFTLVCGMAMTLAQLALWILMSTVSTAYTSTHLRSDTFLLFQRCKMMVWVGVPVKQPKGPGYWLLFYKGITHGNFVMTHEISVQNTAQMSRWHVWILLISEHYSAWLWHIFNNGRNLQQIFIGD